jgi:hypothetical protein
MCTPGVIQAATDIGKTGLTIMSSGLTALGGAFGMAKPGDAPAAPDPAAERAKAEADAANAANVNLAADKRARRANTLAMGGQSDALGATQSAVTNVAKTNVLGGGAA